MKLCRLTSSLAPLAVVTAVVGGLVAATAAAQAPAAPPAPAPAPAAAAPAAPVATPPAPAAAAAPLPVSADEEYAVKMRELEDMVSELKEQVFRSKAKLQLLAEQVAGGVGTGAKIIVVHKNQMGGNYLLISANYFLDGQPLLQETDDTGTKLTPKVELPVFDGNIVEGSHTLSVQLVYKGNGTGVFRYLEAYKWTLKDSVTFTAEPGKVVTIDAIGFEKGNFTTPVEERPAIRFETNISQESTAEGAKGAAAKPAEASTAAPAPTAGVGAK
ncbi:MAG: dihydrolipoamide acetyltransferase [Deltaproteobacteria bacterium]|nr:dihydrolipoamide acetyltransferase [Deltaproteobacteria bacterium]